MKLPFYFDYACPWAYFGSCRVEPYFQDLGVEVDFIPVSLKILHETSPEGGKMPAMGERKRKQYVADLMQWNEMVGGEIPADLPRERPDSSLLLQAASVARDAGRFREFHYPAYRARWAEGRDISKPDVVRGLLEGAGLDGDDALARASSEEQRQRMEAASAAAVERGVFGVPTMFVGDRMFWGNDRFELVRHFLVKEGARA